MLMRISSKGSNNGRKYKINHHICKKNINFATNNNTNGKE